MTQLLTDLRTVVRKLLQSPGFTAIAVFTLALGIGANSAIFSLVNAVLLRPLPYPESDRLVSVGHTAPGLNLLEMPQSDATYLLYREEATRLEALALFNAETVTLTGGDSPERIEGARVSPALFETLRAAQSAGRLLVAEDERPEAPPVVVLGEALFERRYGGDVEVLGRNLAIDGVSHAIVGILPARFDFPEPDVELWLPRTIDPDNAPLGAFSSTAIARLTGELSAEEAEVELNTLLGDLTQTFPEDPAATVLANAGLAAVVEPYRDTVLGDIGGVLWLLLGAVGFVLLVACANVANLFLVRTEGRQRELAIRTALGAGRDALVRLLALESGLLGLLGGALGLLFAAAGLRLLIRLEPSNLPRLHELSIDASVLAFTVAVSLVAGLLFGLLPALRSTRLQLAESLKEGGRAGTGRERQQARNLLAATQIALALVLLIGCGLMVRSFASLSRVDPGILADRVLLFRLVLPENDYGGDMQVADFHQRVIDGLRGLPGVTAAAGTSQPPLTGAGSGAGHHIEEIPYEEDSVPPVIYVRYVSDGYFETLGIRLVEGRTLERADYEERRRVAVINQRLAERYWPGQSPLGKRLAPGRVEDDPDAWLTVVGVVGDVRNRGLHEEPPEIAYYPMIGRSEESPPPARGLFYVVRTQDDPLGLAPAVRELVWGLDPNLPIADLQPLVRMIERAKARWSFTLVLLALAAGVALLLGTIGLYGVLSYLVSQRTPELGLRIALGAQPRAVIAGVLRHGLLLAIAGLVPGLVLALLLAGSMRSLLFGVRPLDPLTFLSVPLLLLAVAALACLLPARRASRVDPIVALRHE